MRELRFFRSEVSFDSLSVFFFGRPYKRDVVALGAQIWNLQLVGLGLISSLSAHYRLYVGAVPLASNGPIGYRPY